MRVGMNQQLTQLKMNMSMQRRRDECAAAECRVVDRQNWPITEIADQTENFPISSQLLEQTDGRDQATTAKSSDAERPGGRPSDREQKAPEWSSIEAAKRPTWATKRPGAGIADTPKWQSAEAAEQSSECSETGFETREQTVSQNNLSRRPSPHARNQKTTACSQSIDPPIDRSVNQLIIQSAQPGKKGKTD